MAYFAWTKEISTGHPEIDKQHRHLFLLAEAVVEPLMSSAEQHPGAAELQALLEFAQQHFEFEEALMRSSACPWADRHAKYHASLMTELKAYFLKVLNSRNTNPAGLIAFLWNWLILHIASEDRGLVDWLKSRESSEG